MEKIKIAKSIAESIHQEMQDDFDQEILNEKLYEFEDLLEELKNDVEEERINNSKTQDSEIKNEEMYSKEDSVIEEKTGNKKQFKFLIVGILIVGLSVLGIGFWKSLPKSENQEDLKIASQEFNITDIKDDEEPIKVDDSTVESNVENSDINNKDIDNSNTSENIVDNNNYDNSKVEENNKKYSENDERYKKDNEELDKAIAELAETPTQQLVASKAKSDGISFINRNKSKNESNNSSNSSESDSNNNSNANYKNGRNEELDRLLNDGKTNNNRIETLNKNRLTKYETIYEVKQGSVIPAILITEVNTDLPGSVLAQVRENVYDTRSGKFLLIPKGSKLYGRYESSVARGQSRVFLVWDRLILPNSKTVDLSTFNTADSLGNSGVTDKVNNHTLALIGNAILSSVLNLGDTLSSGVSFSIGGINVGLNGNKKDGNDKEGSPFKQVTSKIVDQEANRKPTLTIKRGFKFNIIVNGDMILEKYKY